MKIAIPTKDGKIDDHFGHCEYYTIAEVAEDNTVVSQSRFDAPAGCGCKSDVATTLREMGVSVLLCGNMGQGAVNKIKEQDITVVRGCAGDVSAILSSYLSGVILDSGLVCSSHGEDHECSHN